MSIYQRVVNSSSLNLYNGGYWNFVAGPNRTFCSTNCQDNAVFYENNTKLFSYGIAAVNNANLIVETGPAGNKNVPIATLADNEGIIKDVFNTGVVAAYLRQSGD
jgi:glucan 1,3-beta-glucosidase